MEGPARCGLIKTRISIAKSGATQESDESALRVHILPAFGQRSTGSVNRLHIERFLADLASSRSIGTAARVRTTLRGLFDYAVRARVIRDSPAAAVRMPRPDAPSAGAEVRPFTLDELLALVDEHRERPVSWLMSR